MQAPPKVAVVVVAHDPGDYFEECLASISSLGYPDLDIVVVNVDQSGRVDDLTHRLLPNAQVLELPGNPGFGAAVNAGVELVNDAKFFLFCHDDVALAPNALAAMMEVAYATNSGLVTPKIVAYDSPRQILELGSDLDFLMGTATRVEVGDLDQGQYDEINEVAVGAGCAMLVRADLFSSLGGFDASFGSVYQEVDLSCRVRMAGARISTAPHARVRHRSVSTSGRRSPRLRAVRRGVVADERVALSHAERIELKRRHQARCISKLEQGRMRSIALLVFFVERIAEALFLTLTARPRVAWGSLKAIGIITERDALRREREAMLARGLDPRLLTFSGSWLTLRRFLSHNRTRPSHDASRDDPDADSPTTRVERSSLGRWALWVSIALSIVLARSVLFAPTPLKGSFTLYSSPVQLLGAYFSGHGASHLLGVAILPTSDLIIGLLGFVLIGHTALGVWLLVFSSLIIGPIGAYRVARRRLPDGYARASGILYALSPIVAIALVRGSIYAIFGYAIAPLLLAATIDAIAAQRKSRRVMRRSNLRVAALFALAVALAPQLAIVWLLAAVVQVLVYLVTVGPERARRLFVVVCYASVVGFLTNLPWIGGLIVVHPGVDYLFTGFVNPTSSAISSAFGASVVGGLSSWLLAAMVLTLVVVVLGFGEGRDSSLLVATIATVSYTVFAVMAGRGFLGGSPIAPVYPTIMATLIASVALPGAMRLMLRRLRSFGLGIHHVTAGLVTLALVVAALGSALGAIGGQPGPASTTRDTLPLVEGLVRHPQSVLWVELGTGPRIVTGEKLTNGVYVGLTEGVAPTVLTAGAPAVTRGQGALDHLVALALAGRTVRLGDELAAVGVGEVVVVGAPRTVAADAFTTAFGRQLDMAQIFSQGGISVYRLTARPASLARAATPFDPWLTVGIVIQLVMMLILLLGLFGRRSWLRARTRGQTVGLGNAPASAVPVPVGPRS
ncbi:glycosyltransferase family 2 protein [Ferrimicrobium acidiphilum]|jgi:GT2 family glycosyltransferase|uniref:glycosyltransferase family 2 protein n=1 Tax=Ferrimicrobium acidiphilum TaxID=121039 RepID=UPI0023EFFE9D|nr:glycosyltransferase family 2 protein [Ferrimicrobium acidiphilum]MCL5053277.1 glycosyltransferase family 2 protein [Gammaproteobacteria bacterium]